MKIALVYTSTTPELISEVNSALSANLEGIDAEIAVYQNPGILASAREANKLTPWCVGQLIDLYEQARKDGAGIILSLCSSVGDAARLCKPLYEMAGIRFIRVDEAMAREAVLLYDSIGIIATLPTTMAPTKGLIEMCANELGKTITIHDTIAEGTFGMNREYFIERLIRTGAAVKDRVQAIVLAQGSMAYAREAISEALGLPVLASVEFGARAVRSAALEILKEERL